MTSPTGSSERTVAIRLVLDGRVYKAEAKQVADATDKVRKSTQELDEQAKKTSQTHVRSWKDIGDKAGVAGAVVTASIGGMIAVAARFDQQMSAVAAVMSNDVPNGLAKLRAAAIEASRDTVFSASQAAQAEEELAKAGISTADVLGGALKGSLSLAAAGSLDLADAATIAAQAMNIFHLRGADVGHIADVLAAGANKSAADVGQLGDALRQGGLIAAQTGLSLEDTVGVLSAFADRALVGSDAGTSLKTMLQTLANPSQQSAALMKQLGIEVYDAQGKFIGITKLAQVLQDKLGGLSQAQRDAAMAQIFGSDATRAASVLYNQGAKGIQSYIDAMNDDGAAADAAAKKTDNLTGDLHRLRAAVESVAIGGGSGGTAGGLRGLTRATTDAVNVFGALPGPVQETVTIVGGLSGASLLAAAGLLKVRSTATDAMQALRDTGRLSMEAQTRLASIGSMAGKFSLWGAAALATYEGVHLLFDALPYAKTVAPDVDRLASSISHLAQTGKAAGEVARVLGPDLGSLRRQTEDLNKAMSSSHSLFGAAQGAVGSDVAAARSHALADTYKSLDAALAQLVQSGNATAAATMFNRLVEAGYGVDDLTKNLPSYTSAVINAGGASSALAQGFGSATDNAYTMAHGLDAAAKQGQSLTDVFNQLNGAATGLAHAQIDVEQALDDMTESFRKNGNSLKIDDQAGRDNLDTVLRVADAASKAAQAKYQQALATQGEAGALQAAKAVYDNYISRLRAALLDQHLSKQTVDDLISAYAQLPSLVVTQFQAPGLVTANDTATGYKKLLDSMDGRTVTTYFHDAGQLGTPNRRPQRWGGVTEHAAVGALRDAAVYAAGSSPLYAFAEPETGGEAFVPKRGDYGRSMGILATAASWYGAAVVPMSSQSGTRAAAAAPVVNVAPPSVRVYIGDEEITGRVRVVVDRHDRATAAAVDGGVRY